MAEYVDRYDIGSQESSVRRMSDIEIVKRIVMDYMMRHKTLFTIQLVLIFFKMFTVIARPYLYKTVLDFYIAQTPTDDAVWLANIINSLAVSLANSSEPQLGSLLLVAALLYVVIAVVEWAVTTTQLYYIEKLGLYVIADIRADFFSHINNLSQRFFEYGNTGKLVSRVTNDAEALKKILSTGVIGLVADLIMTLSIVLVMAFIDSQLTLVALLIAPLLAVASRVFQGWIKEAWRTARRNVASLTGKVQDLMYGAKLTKSLVQEERSLLEFDETNERNMQTQIRAETVSVAYSSVATVLGSIMTAAIWYLGGMKILGATRTIGQLVAFSNYSESFFTPIQSLAMLYGEIQSALAGAERIFVILDQEPEVQERENPIQLDEMRGEIEFKEIHFSYIPDQPVLKNINLRIKPGEKIAIFGPTGSGKSTIINLLGRFYDPVEGQVIIDKHDLRDLSFSSLRRAVSIVLQEPYLFNGTVDYNLKFGNLKVSDAEMIRVAKYVGIHNAITELEDGYGTVLHERGTNLSYGQRQLICLARAIIADPSILVFDEATSSVDPYTEAKIQETLRQEMMNRTVILVTHRVSTVRDMDRIIVLEDGMIKNEGTHDQLIQRSSLYRELCEMQLVEVNN
ncbi:MAG: ABC transporter ATP-binding protein/permease [Candidatus Bathyarchaeota archaeon]|nr:ABC transporter ATP-binding protein/permease [Candidatus Bathyarchaeota archaeon]